MFLPRLFEEFETACAMSSRIFSAWRSPNLKSCIGKRPRGDPTAATHLHRLTVEKMDVGLLLLCALADQQKERSEVFLRVDCVAAVDRLVGVALQLVLEGEGEANASQIQPKLTIQRPPRPSGVRSHQALDVSEENGFCSNIQEHLLTPQLFVLSQEGEPFLGFLHALHIPILE